MFKSIYLIPFVFIFSIGMLHAQEDVQQETKPRPVRNTFESIWLIDNQTVDVPFKNTFEWDIQHRFGTWENGYEDYFGLAAPSNIRLGFVYVPLENLQVGFGITKERKIWDFHAKYVLIKQKQDSGFPFSIAYFGSVGLDSRDLDSFVETSDRYSYFNQLMIARKFTDRLALQIAPSFSYFNSPELIYSDEGNFVGAMNNTHFAISALGRLGLTDRIGLILSMDFAVTDHQINNPENNISIGVEFTTSSHAFQVFVGNYQSINPQYNHLLNQNSFGDGDILIGFNITRLWNF
ncbi:MAG: hypothetical protein KJP00_12085 [Bacteroidia bacterium]|nr:hypothetical protein [Bacteroidia bacterium]